MNYEIYGLDHLLIAIPRGAEETARAFYCAVLGFREIPKPESLAGRGGLWLQGGSLTLHLGIEDDFRPARRAHPGLLVRNLAGIVAASERAGAETSRDVPLPGYERMHVFDPFGNRLELLERRDCE